MQVIELRILYLSHYCYQETVTKTFLMLQHSLSHPFLLRNLAIIVVVFKTQRTKIREKFANLKPPHEDAF